MANALQPVEKPQTPKELTKAEIEALVANDPLVTAVGLYTDLWAGEHADEYIARLRKDW